MDNSMVYDITKIAITPEILNLIAEIDEFKGTWQAFDKLAPKRLLSLKKIATIESIGSSTRIEGAKLSDKEIEHLLSNLQKKSFRTRDEQEVAGYAYTCEEIFTNFINIPFSENSIKQLHKWLLQYSEKDVTHRGEYKKLSNTVEAFDENGKSIGIIFETATPFETPFKMQELVNWLRETLQTKALHPLLTIGIFVIIFLAIHPFQDGNGRLSRILTTLLLLQNGYIYVPYSSLENIIENNKESYYLALRRSQQTLKTSNADFTPWLLFFLRALQKQKTQLQTKIAREKLIIADLPAKATEIITIIREHGNITIEQLEKITKINRSTLKKYLSLLVKNKHIMRLGKGRATYYTW